MKKIILAILSFIIISCSWEWTPPEPISFEEATSHITELYGEPAVVRDTVFYEDGTVRNRVAYWDIDPPEEYEVTIEYGGGRLYTYTSYYTTYSVEAWNQPDGSLDGWKIYRHYGWELLRGNKGKYQYIEN